MVLEPGDGQTPSRFGDKFRAEAKLWQLGAADTSASRPASANCCA
jgi:hypothetical protein